MKMLLPILFVLMVTQLLPPTATRAASYVMSGRVYVGTSPDETIPLYFATMLIYCSNNHADLGSVLDSTATDYAGYYEFVVDGLCDYYNIIEQNPSSYTSKGASTPGGQVITADWIEYSSPLSGKILTGNKFWDESGTAKSYIFQGKVLVGDIPSESVQCAGVTISLYFSFNPMPAPGTLINVTATNVSGWYEMGTTVQADYYRIVLTVPNRFRPAGALSIDGTIYSPTQIDIVLTPALPHISMGNRFWIKHGLYIPFIMR